MSKKKIAILLPFKDHFTNSKAGSTSIWVKDFNKKSKYKDQISIYGNTPFLNDLIDKKKYKNILRLPFFFLRPCPPKTAMLDLAPPVGGGAPEGALLLYPRGHFRYTNNWQIQQLPHCQRASCHIINLPKSQILNCPILPSKSPNLQM